MSGALPCPGGGPMPLYVTVSRGPRADLAKPVLASSDRTVVGAVLEAVRRLAESEDGERDDAAAGRVAEVRLIRFRDDDGRAS